MSSWLYIDTRTRASAKFGWIKQNGPTKFWSVKAGSPGLVSTLSKKIKVDELKKCLGICLVRGPGSFSSVRTGSLVANLLAKLSGLPLYAIEANEGFDETMVTSILATSKPVEYAPPLYDQEPNITIKKL